MTRTIKRVARARDKRTDKQLQQNIDVFPPAHASTHFAGGDDEITPADIGAETPTDAQTKADTAESNANDYTDTHEAKSNPHSGSQPRQGGITLNRPATPEDYEFYFDTTLGQPIWFDGSNWVDATGTTV